jgi:hypothetical protein
MGVRTSFALSEDGSANGGSWSNTFGVENARIYINGKIHKYVGFEFNTECFTCNGTRGSGGGAQISTDSSNIGLLDAIGKFEFNQYVNLWVGRMLVTGARDELNGPFYSAFYESFKTPLNSADFRGTFGNGGAGRYGRDNGATFWGQVDPGFGHLQYSLGVFTGVNSCGNCLTGGLPGGPNQQNSLLYAGRLTYNLLNPEKNPGYYTSNTYYGTAGDILALAVGVNHQKNGAGSFAAASDFTLFIGDFLFEKPLANNGGVITLTAEYKQYFANYNQNVAFAPTATPGECFCMFDGSSYQGAGLFLIPNEIGIGRFQPYARYTSVQPNNSKQRQETEGGVNYIISGHNARISLFAQYGNLASLGTNYDPTANGVDNYAVKAALQIQY